MTNKHWTGLTFQLLMMFLLLPHMTGAHDFFSTSINSAAIKLGKMVDQYELTLPGRKG